MKNISQNIITAGTEPDFRPAFVPVFLVATVNDRKSGYALSRLSAGNYKSKNNKNYDKDKNR